MELPITSINIFESTVAWELAKQVKQSDIVGIENILSEHPNWVDTQDPVYGTTLLMWAVASEKYRSAETLLLNGANPNIISKTGTTALFRAVSFSWYDNEANEDPKFVKLLLDFKADPNIGYCAPKEEGYSATIECGTSPLMHATSRGVEKAKLLIEAGADINYQTRTKKTAAIMALLLKDVDLAYYLIVDKKADVKQPYFFTQIGNDDIVNVNEPHYPVDLLLNWVFELDSEEQYQKKAIVAEFEKQGVDYNNRKGKIRNTTLRKIKKMHPDDWESYIEKY